MLLFHFRSFGFSPVDLNLILPTRIRPILVVHPSPGLLTISEQEQWVPAISELEIPTIQELAEPALLLLEVPAILELDLELPAILELDLEVLAILGLEQEVNQGIQEASFLRGSTRTIPRVFQATREHQPDIMVLDIPVTDLELDIQPLVKNPDFPRITEDQDTDSHHFLPWIQPRIRPQPHIRPVPGAGDLNFNEFIAPPPETR